MKHSHYLKLGDPKTIRIADDDEAPTVDAPVLKIVRVDGPDELHQHAFIHVYYMYGYVNSKSVFVPLDDHVYVDFVCDVPDDGDGNGLNPASGLREAASSWFADLTTPKKNQEGRVNGDFRMMDLYDHLMTKYAIKGEVVS